jgi:type VI protein secretion system component VasK
MASNPNPNYRWLQIAGIAVLVLAALVLAYAWHRTSENRRQREDIGVRAQEMMNQIEAEAARMENATAQP